MLYPGSVCVRIIKADQVLAFIYMFKFTTQLYQLHFFKTRQSDSAP